jgi:two-component SAPR family response regulator
MLTDKIDEAIELLKEGGTIDGAHHKQYYITQALKALLGDEFDKHVDISMWEKGVAG